MTVQPKWYSPDEIRRRLSYERLIQGIGEGLAQVAAGALVEQHDSGIRDPARGVNFVAYPAVWPAARLATLKVLSSIRDNPSRGLPRIHALIVAIDAATGEVLATLDGATVTAMRTAATTALAARQLAAGRQIDSVAVLGTGAQGETHIEALASVFPRARLSIASASGNHRRADSHAAMLAERLGRRVDALSMSEAVTSDVVACVTSSLAPLFPAEAAASDGVLLSVSPFTPVRQEIDPRLLAAPALVVVDDVARMEGHWSDSPQPAPWQTLHSLEDLVEGRVDVPAGSRRVFLSQGRAFEDLMATALVLDRIPAAPKV